MSKIKKIIVSFLVMLSCASFVFASSVNMNLTSENNIDVNSVSNNTSTSNSVSNSITSNEVNSTSTNSAMNSNEVSSNIATGIQSVNNINDVSNSSLGIGQILNIFLIAVGLILILLAIAILIRLK